LFAIADNRHIKKGVVLTLYLRQIESRKFKIHPQDKAMANVHSFDIYCFVYAISVGCGIAYSRMEGDARA